MSEGQLRPFQFTPIDEDVLFADGATHTLKPVQSTTGAGDDIRLSAADALAASAADGGNVLLKGGAGDGVGLKGNVLIEEGCVVLNEAVTTEFIASTATQVGLVAIDDAGDTEFAAKTSGGLVQITKDGAINAGATTAVVTQSVESTTFSVVSGGSGSPLNGTLGDFRTLDYGAGLQREVRSEVNMPREFRDSPLDTVTVKFKYAITAGANTTVRLSTFGGADNNTLAAEIYDLDVSAVTPGEIVESPVIRTIAATDADTLTSLALIVRRDILGGEFTGDFRLVNVVFEFQALNSVVAISRSTFQFVTLLGSPVNGTVGAFNSVDLIPGVVSEVGAFFNIPNGYQLGSRAFIRVSFAMSTAEVGQSVNLQVSGSINNVTVIPTQSVTVNPGSNADEIELSTSLLTVAGLARLDDVLLRVKRMGTGSHGGSIRLIAAILEMGSSIVTSSDPVEYLYDTSDKIGSVGGVAATPSTDTLTELTEGETYDLALGDANNQDVTFVHRAGLPAIFSSIASFEVPYKFSSVGGNNALEISVIDATGSLLYGPVAVAPSATRAVAVVSGASLSSQPASGERFLVLAKATVDLGETIHASNQVLVKYS